MRMHERVRPLCIGACCTCIVLVTACGGAPAADDAVRSNMSAAADHSGFPLDVLHRTDLQQLVDAGLDRRTAPLLAALDDMDPVVRATAAHALASVQDAATLPRLTALLADADAAVRRNAAFAIGQTGAAASAAGGTVDGGGATALIDALRNESDPAVRLTLHEAIGRIGSAADLASLIGAAMDANAAASPAIHADGPGLSLALYHFARRGVTDARATPVLLALLDAADEATRMRAALALAAPRSRTSGSTAPDDLRAALNAMSAARREAAPLLRILAVQGHYPDTPTLPGWLADSAHWTVRTAAAAALGGDTAMAVSREAVAALMRALDDPSPHVAGVAATSLVALKSRAGARAGPDTDAWVEWIRAHLERHSVAAALLPGLVGSPHESLVIDWATGRLGPDVPRALSFPALALVATPTADSLLTAGLLGARRESYVAAAALAQRLEDLPADAALRTSLIPILTSRIEDWGPHAPGSDVRGVLRLMAELLEADPSRTGELVAAAARHAHPDIRAAALRAGAEDTSSRAEPRRRVNWSLLASTGPRPCLVFTTALGEFIAELHPEAAPLAVSALMEWAAAGAFDDLTFHRVEPDFILQSGDFDNERGYGGPERGLRSEFSLLRFAPGVLGMASSAKDTEGSQFFITHNHAPSLDGRYSAVGRVIAGLAVTEEIALGDALVAVTPFQPGADTASNERSTRCTSERT